MNIIPDVYSCIAAEGKYITKQDSYLQLLDAWELEHGVCATQFHKNNILLVQHLFQKFALEPLCLGSTSFLFLACAKAFQHGGEYQCSNELNFGNGAIKGSITITPY